MRLDRQGKQEQMPPENGVYKKNGKWFMRYDNMSDGAEIPANIARLINIALWLERRNRTDIHNIRTAFLQRRINCHQAVLYAMGLIGASKLYNPLDADYYFFGLNIKNYRLCKTYEELSEYLRSRVGNSTGLAQILRVPGRDRHEQLEHSFLLSFDSDNRAVCFEKVGSKSRYPFRIVPLEDIYKDHSNHFWAAGTIDEIEKTALAKRMRSRLSAKGNVEER